MDGGRMTNGASDPGEIKRRVLTHLKDADRHIKSGEFGAAEKDIESALELDPDNVYARAYKARLKSGANETQKRELLEDVSPQKAIPAEQATAAKRRPATGRKLAAIMFTDMVGYSALTQRNESLAVQLLEEHRRMIRSALTRYEGEEIKTIGDAFLVDFSSVLNAARCALEIHKVISDRNQSTSAERRIQLRIGIHLGDVIFQEEDLVGDGVNIASRIQERADPAGICISQDVYNQIRNRDEFHCEPVGEAQLKNIIAPIPLFKLYTGEELRRKYEEKAFLAAEAEGRKRARQELLATFLDSANDHAGKGETEAALTDVLSVLIIEPSNADAKRLEMKLKEERSKLWKAEVGVLRQVPREIFLEVYRKAIKEAWGDGALLSVERSLLEATRVSFQISEAEHDEIEREVKREIYAGIMQGGSAGSVPALEEWKKEMGISDEEHAAIERELRGGSAK